MLDPSDTSLSKIFNENYSVLNLRMLYDNMLGQEFTGLEFLVAK